LNHLTARSGPRRHARTVHYEAPERGGQDADDQSLARSRAPRAERCGPKLPGQPR
jgi:hypothetical protein